MAQNPSISRPIWAGTKVVKGRMEKKDVHTGITSAERGSSQIIKKKRISAPAAAGIGDSDHGI